MKTAQYWPVDDPLREGALVDVLWEQGQTTTVRFYDGSVETVATSDLEVRA